MPRLSCANGHHWDAGPLLRRTCPVCRGVRLPAASPFGAAARPSPPAPPKPPTPTVPPLKTLERGGRRVLTLAALAGALAGLLPGAGVAVWLGVRSGRLAGQARDAAARTAAAAGAEQAARREAEEERARADQAEARAADEKARCDAQRAEADRQCRGATAPDL